MPKLKSEILTQEILEILAEIQKLKKKYKDFEHFPAIEIHLNSACKGIHELTLKIKNQEKEC